MYREFMIWLRLWVDELRVRWHLQRVERRLRSEDVSHLPFSVKVARRERLDVLHRYWRYEHIPRNFKYDRSIPCFIDRMGRRCAVAHLVVESGYGKVAQMIAAEANDAYIEDMAFPEIDRWAKQNGFTKDELALIQPTYCPAPEGAQLVTATLVIYLVSWLIVIAEFPFAIWNFFQGVRRNVEGRRAINSSVKLSLLLIVFAAIIAFRIATGNDVLSDWRVLETTHGYDGQPCEDIVYRVTYKYVALLIAISFVYLGSTGWRVYRGQY